MRNWGVVGIVLTVLAVGATAVQVTREEFGELAGRVTQLEATQKLLRNEVKAFRRGVRDVAQDEKQPAENPVSTGDIFPAKMEAGQSGHFCEYDTRSVVVRHPSGGPGTRTSQSTKVAATFHVSEVWGPEEVLVYWDGRIPIVVRGVSTKNMVTGKVVTFSETFRVIGTETYYEDALVPLTAWVIEKQE